MHLYLQNSIDFSAECASTNGQCEIGRDNILFLNDGREDVAVHHLQIRCGNVVIVPDSSNNRHSWMFHTSCQRMTDAVTQIFEGDLQPPASVARPISELTVGEVQRQGINLSVDECRAKVDSFSF